MVKEKKRTGQNQKDLAPALSEMKTLTSDDARIVVSNDDNDIPAKLRLYETYIDSGLMPKHIQTPQQALIVSQYAKEINISPLSGLMHIPSINGKPSLDGIALQTVLRSHGFLWKTEADFQECSWKPYPALLPEWTSGSKNYETRIKFWHPNGQEEIGSFSFQEAIHIGLMDKSVYKDYTNQMVWWRAFSNGGRRIAGDKTLGLYIPDEIGGDMNPDGSHV